MEAGFSALLAAIRMPEGATIATSSGSQYHTKTLPVSEPGTSFALFLSFLGIATFRKWRISHNERNRSH